MEHKTPPLSRRLEAIYRLQKRGWPIGLRFDPMIYLDGYEDIYARFFQEVFQSLDSDGIHSVSLGSFRLPKTLYQNMLRQYPKEKLFAQPLTEKGGLLTIEKEREHSLMAFCQKTILTNKRWIAIPP